MNSRRNLLGYGFCNGNGKPFNMRSFHSENKMMALGKGTPFHIIRSLRDFY